uniref:Reverse transcriptase zinc-binding domain-containing protein n=1 Tax=Aegilops tauschii subsp. strangulata TaxID=200361 RepID=A0A453K6B6_AEGTS
SSCYQALFLGACEEPHWKLTWKSWAPLRVKFFMWLALQDRCWTAERLAIHGLPHEPACALCDQEDETMQHLMAGCSFSHQVWYDVLAWDRFPTDLPTGDTDFLT